MRRHIFGIIPLFIFLLLQGCGMNTAELLQQNLDLGQAMLIFPVLEQGQDSGVGWGRLESGTAPEDGSLPVIMDTVSLGRKYAAMTVRPGSYYVRYLGSRVAAGNRELEGKQAFSSRFGEIRVNKTPSRRYRLERVWEPAEYEWVGGRRVRVWDGYWETRVRTDRVPSYLEAVLDVLALPPGAGGSGGPGNGADFIGTVTANAGDVLLIPGIRAEISLTDGSCSFKGHEAPPGYAELAGQTGYTAYFNGSGGSGRESLFYNAVFQCPVESLTITLIRADLADLRQWVDGKDLPAGTLQRVTEGRFKPGRIFDGEHQVRPFSHSDSRIFSSDVTYSGEQHIFPGRIAQD